MNIKDYPNVTLLDHPLIKHKISHLRMKETPTSEFRQFVKEIAMMEGFEALRHLETVPTLEIGRASCRERV